MRVVSAIAVAVMGLWPRLASAAVTQSDFVLTTTQDLYDVCSVGPDDPLRPQALSFCEGFIVGAVSYHDAISDRKNLKRFFCYQPSDTRDQGIKAFVDWAAAHQQDQKYMNEPPVIGVVRAFAAKWPCK